MSDERKKLRAYLYSLLGIKKVFDEYERHNIHSDSVDVLEREVTAINKDFPALVPEFIKNDYLSHSENSGTYYQVNGIRSYLPTVISRIQAEIESDEGLPITQRRDFSFISDPDLQTIIERDYSEIQRAFVAKCWKSVIILSGGAIEATLTDVLLVNETLAKSASKAPRKPDIRNWDLADLINVSLELKFVQSGVDKLSHSVREYRNLVHPGNELRRHLTFDEEEAKIALEVFHMIHRDLSP